jgi:hypothetical protein
MKWTHFDVEKPPESTTLLVIFEDAECLMGFYRDNQFHSFQKYKYPKSHPEYWRIMDRPLTIKQNPLKTLWLVLFLFGTVSAMDQPLDAEVLQARQLHLYTARILLLPKTYRDFIILFVKNLVVTAEKEADGKEESVS